MRAGLEGSIKLAIAGSDRSDIVLHPSQVAVHGHTPSPGHRNDESGAPDSGKGASRANDCKAIGGSVGEKDRPGLGG